MATHEHAFAKLTRTLRVVGRRSDGYHLLESEMVTLDLADDLAFSPAATSSLEVDDEIAWQCGRGATTRALEIPTDRSNLVLQALELANSPAAVRLTKRIPAGAGLGGGSADAAAALRYAGVTDPAIAVTLGADVPFCLAGGRALVRGVGEILDPLEPVELDVVVVTPAFGVSTPSVYRAFDELGHGGGRNDLERAAIAVEPRLQAVRDLVGSVSGQEPVLAGSGSSYFVECGRAVAAALGSDLVQAALNEAVVVTVSVCSATGPIRNDGGGRRAPLE